MFSEKLLKYFLLMLQWDGHQHNDDVWADRVSVRNEHRGADVGSTLCLDVCSVSWDHDILWHS